MEAFLSIYKSLSDHGELITTNDHVVFFGNDQFNLNLLKKIKTAPSLLHQVHGPKVIQAPKLFEKADGQWTQKKGLSLIIKTADCLPVFLSEGERVLALHVGWRGFTCNIFEAAMAHINEPRKAKLYIGPHIGFNSFQVDVITAANILRSQNLTWNQTNKLGLTKTSYNRKDHFYVDLRGILLKKAKEFGFQSIHASDLDTCTSPNHFSHRRNPYRVGTNYSFIARI